MFPVCASKVQVRQSVAPLVLHVVFVCSPGRSGQLQAEGADSLGKKQRAREKLLLACPFDWLQSDPYLVHFCRSLILGQCNAGIIIFKFFIACLLSLFVLCARAAGAITPPPMSHLSFQTSPDALPNRNMMLDAVRIENTYPNRVRQITPPSNEQPDKTTE